MDRKPTFQLDHLQWGPKNYPHPQVSFLLLDCVGNYDIGKMLGRMPGLRISLIFNQFKVMDTIEFVVNDIKNRENCPSWPNLQGELEKAYYRDVIRDYNSEVNHYNVLPWMLEEEPGDLYAISIYGGSWEEAMNNLHTFHSKFLASVDQVANDAGGDDEFFDYAPSYVDEYRQFCDYFKLYEEYKSFVESLPKDFREEALYCNEITPV